MERWHKVVLLTAVYCSYLIAGSLIFQALEKGEEENLRRRVINTFGKFLVNNTCVDTLELQFLVNEVVHAYSNGLRFEENNITSFGKYLWDFSNALFFSTTVITTIGYGNMTPSTGEGKLFCMFFALFGIPLTGIFASMMGIQLENHWNNVINKLNQSISSKKNAKLKKSFITFVVALSLYLVIVCVPALIVNQIEGWGFLLSHYYAFISISTIGFGDYVAGNGSKMSDTARAFYKLGLVIYFVFGFVILTIIFKMSQKIHDKQVRKVRRFTSSVKGRIRRASMFPSQSSSGDTPRSSVRKSDNGTETHTHKQSVHSRRKRSPTYQTNGHIKRKFDFRLTHKTNRKRPSSLQEIKLNVSNSTVISKDLSTVRDEGGTVSSFHDETVSSFHGSDDVFTSAINATVHDFLTSPVLDVPSKSLQDLRHVIEKNANAGVFFDGCRTL